MRFNYLKTLTILVYTAFSFGASLLLCKEFHILNSPQMPYCFTVFLIPMLFVGIITYINVEAIQNEKER